MKRKTTRRPDERRTRRLDAGPGAELEKESAVLGNKAGPVGDAKGGARLVLDALREIQPDLDALDAAARERPRSQIPFGGALLPSVRALRFFARALNLRAAAELELGRTDEAFQDVYASLRLAQGAGGYPHMVMLSMGNVMASLAIQPLWEGCSRHAWNAAQLETFQGTLLDLHLLRKLPEAFAATRAAYDAGYQSFLAKPFWMPEGWWLIGIVRFFQHHVGGGDPSWFDSARERINPAEIARSDATVDGLRHSRSPLDWLSRHEAWGSKFTAAIGFGHNRIELAATACALERFRCLTGKYPADLSSLVPALLDAVPRDVIDGEPLRYVRLGDDRYELYSIGLSGLDDRDWPGRPDFSWWTSKAGHWVWRQGAGKHNSVD